MRQVVGVDPGKQSGAAVLLDNGSIPTVLDWMVWWRTKKGEEIKVIRDGMDAPLYSLAFSRELAWWADGIRPHTQAGYTLAVESVGVTRKAAAASSVVLAEWTGRALGVLEPRSVNATKRPRSQQWRADVLGLSPRNKAQQCEDYAIHAVDRGEWTHNGQHFQVKFPRGFPGLKPNPRSREWCEQMPRIPRGALAEAVCIAVWGGM